MIWTKVGTAEWYQTHLVEFKICTARGENSHKLRFVMLTTRFVMYLTAESTKSSKYAKSQHGNMMHYPHFQSYAADSFLPFPLQQRHLVWNVIAFRVPGANRSLCEGLVEVKSWLSGGMGNGTLDCLASWCQGHFYSPIFQTRTSVTQPIATKNARNIIQESRPLERTKKQTNILQFFCWQISRKHAHAKMRDHRG